MLATQLAGDLKKSRNGPTTTTTWEQLFREGRGHVREFLLNLTLEHKVDKTPFDSSGPRWSRRVDGRLSGRALKSPAAKVQTGAVLVLLFT